MSTLKKLTLPLLFFGFSLQAFEPSCFYDYGYPPPLETGSDLGDIFVDAEWLFLKPSVDHLFFAEERVLPKPEATILPILAHRETPHFKWDSGIRAFLGYSLPLDQWAVQASYIYYRTHANKKIAATLTSDLNHKNDYIVPLLAETVVDVATLGKTGASSRWSWNLNILDVDLSRVSYFNRAFSIRPNAGFRFLWSHQKFNPTYFDEPTDFGVLGLNIQQQNSSVFNAFGLKVGVDTLWYTGFCGVSLFGNFDFALLTGDLKLRQTFIPGQIETGIEFVSPLKSRENPRTMKQMLHGSFGIEWETSFDCESMFLLVKAAFEQFYFPQLNQLTGRTIIGDSIDPLLTLPYSVQGDMGLYGLSLGATLIF